MAMTDLRLGVNIDHVATIRQARGTAYPSIVEAARLAEEAGADGITVHLREDRRHIQDVDVVELRASLKTRMNLEMAATEEMVDFACDICPDACCIVPEKRDELTTEGGLDVVSNRGQLENVCSRLSENGIAVSLFIDPDEAQIESAARLNVFAVELHTGRYGGCISVTDRVEQLKIIAKAAKNVVKRGLHANAGHGLNLANVRSISEIEEFEELNIGHSIISRSIFVGLRTAVSEMKEIMQAARS